MSDIDIFDYVALVQNNPLTRLSSDYGSKIIQKIKSKFTDEDQQLFVANFYCYLNFNQKTDFVINLDRIWKWLGYSRVDHCKTLLLKNFKENIDYKIEKGFPEDAGKPKLLQEQKNLGGRPSEYITLTVNCFKKLCLKARTEKADQIHDYYIQLEDLLNELVTEQTEELHILV
jgi:phage anti-repressor protein